MSDANRSLFTARAIRCELLDKARRIRSNGMAYHKAGNAAWGREYFRHAAVYRAAARELRGLRP